MGFFNRIKQAREAERMRQEMNRNIENQFKRIEPQLRENIFLWTTSEIKQANINIYNKDSFKFQQFKKCILANEKLIETELIRLFEDIALAGFESGFLSSRDIQYDKIHSTYFYLESLLNENGIKEKFIIEEYQEASYRVHNICLEFGRENGNIQDFIIMRR